MSGSHTVAAIDCGTNSIRLLIASADSDGVWSSRHENWKW